MSTIAASSAPSSPTITASSSPLAEESTAQGSYKLTITSDEENSLYTFEDLVKNLSNTILMSQAQFNTTVFESTLVTRCQYLKLQITGESHGDDHIYTIHSTSMEILKTTVIESLESCLLVSAPQEKACLHDYLTQLEFIIAYDNDNIAAMCNWLEKHGYEKAFLHQDMSPLEVAAFNDEHNTLSLLELFAPSRDSKEILKSAIKGNSQNVINYLLDKGEIEVTLGDFILAVEENCEKSFETLCDRLADEGMRVLVKHFSDPEFEKSYYPLLYRIATYKNGKPALDFFLKQGEIERLAKNLEDLHVLVEYLSDPEFEKSYYPLLYRIATYKNGKPALDFFLKQGKIKHLARVFIEYVKAFHEKNVSEEQKNFLEKHITELCDRGSLQKEYLLLHKILEFFPQQFDMDNNPNWDFFYKEIQDSFSDIDPTRFLAIALLKKEKSLVDLIISYRQKENEINCGKDVLDFLVEGNLKDPKLWKDLLKIYKEKKPLHLLLHKAISEKRTEVAQALINANILSLNGVMQAVDCDNNNLFHLFIHQFTGTKWNKDLWEKAKMIFYYLKKKGCDINHANRYKRSPLDEACHAREPRLIKILVALGADVNKKENSAIFSLVPIEEKDREHMDKWKACVEALDSTDFTETTTAEKTVGELALNFSFSECSIYSWSSDEGHIGYFTVSQEQEAQSFIYLCEVYFRKLYGKTDSQLSLTPKLSPGDLKWMKAQNFFEATLGKYQGDQFFAEKMPEYLKNLQQTSFVKPREYLSS